MNYEEKIKELQSKLSEYENPESEFYEFAMPFYGSLADYTVHYEYEAGSEDSEYEQGWDEYVTINSVWNNGANVIDDLSDAILKRIEESALEDIKDKIKTSYSRKL